MEFDRTGPEGGLEIYSRIQNQKAYLEFKIHLRKSAMEELMEESGALEQNVLPAFPTEYFDIYVWDKEEKLVLYCRHALTQDNQEELPKGLLIHPHFWQGVEEPYLYRIKITLMAGLDCVADVMEDTLAIRSFQQIPGRGWTLNDVPFEIRPVAYEIPCTGMEKSLRYARVRQDLKLICGMGANTICPIKGELTREFCHLCDEMGLVLWWGNPLPEGFGKSLVKEGVLQKEIPRFYGTRDSLLMKNGHNLESKYYYYMACWSKEPFVYICADSLQLQKNGCATVTVYSNQKKVALYVEGIVFEFQKEGPEFVFYEIPVKKLPLQLSAEAEECSMSLTAYPLHRFFTN